MQVDWIEFKRERLSAFVATMGRIRASYIEYVTDEHIEALVACHVRAFEFFGGAPCEVLYDYMKTVVIERDDYGERKHRSRTECYYRNCTKNRAYRSDGRK